jgi:hypothetical protein
VFTSLFAEGINLFLLTYQHTVEHCIIHFVALEVIMEVSNMYFEALMNNKLKEVLHSHYAPKREKSIKDIVWKDRSCFHKVARILYKIIRCVYVSLIFYFVPFLVVFLGWNANVKTE